MGTEPFTDSHLANLVIGFLASPSHLECAELVARNARFTLTAIGGLDASLKAVDRLFPSLATDRLRDFLTTVLRGLAEDAGYHVAEIAADFPPHDAVRISVLPGRDLPAVALTFSR